MNASSDEARVGLAVTEGVATITLLRSAQLNALDEAMHAGLRAAIREVESDVSVRALVLAGSGNAFSTGQDLKERAAVFARGEQPNIRASLEDQYNPLVRAIARLPIPVIAAVNGIAFGAGAALVIACDLVVASASACFQFGFVNVGLGPDSGVSWFLPRIVGQARALDLALTGRAVTAQEALTMGLVSRVVADAELMPTVSAIAAGLTLRSPEALREIKRQLRDNPIGQLDAALDAERDAQAQLGLTNFYRDAVLGFAARKR